LWKKRGGENVKTKNGLKEKERLLLVEAVRKENIVILDELSNLSSETKQVIAPMARRIAESLEK